MKDRTEVTPAREDKTKIIGVVSDEFTHPCTITLLNELTRQLNQRHCLTLLLNVNSRDGYQSVLQTAAQRQIDGLVFLATLAHDELSIAADLLPRVPSVHLCQAGNAVNTQAIVIDGHKAGQQVAQLLLSQAFTRFGYMQAQDTAPQAPMQGYADGLATVHHSLKQVLTAGGYDREHAYRATMAYLKQTWAADRIDALFCENDELAFGAIQAIRDFGEKVHMGVIGIGDTTEAHSPTWHLTSLSPRNDLLIEEALNRLLDNRMDEQGAWRQGVLKVRHSHLGRRVLSEPSQCGCASRH